MWIKQIRKLWGRRMKEIEMDSALNIVKASYNVAEGQRDLFLGFMFRRFHLKQDNYTDITYAME